MLTFGEVKDSSITNVVGKCPTGAAFAQYVNDASRRLTRRGDWFGSIVPIHLCVQAGCVVFPRYVGTVRKVNWCQRSMNVSGLWATFLNWNPAAHWHHQWFAGHFGGECGWQQEAESPVFSDIAGDGRLLRAYPMCAADAGKTFTVFGVDNNGQELMEENPVGSGSWQGGVTLTIASPFGSTSRYIRRIDRLLKDKTQCPVRLYGYNATQDLLEDVGYYAPSETNPSFARYRLSFQQPTGGVPTSGCATCCNKFGVVALVKLRWIKAEADSDPVFPGNLDALKLMIQSIKAQEAGDPAGARQFEVDALRELNRELEDAIPDQQVAVSISPLGRTSIGQMKCF